MGNNEDLTWQVNKTLAECNRYMLDHEIASDVTFLVGADNSARSISAHKYILASRSPVFFAMLFGNLSKDNNETIVVPDISPDAFMAMLRFLYCEESNFTFDLVLPTLYASKKYIIPLLTEHCLLFLEENLDVDNVCLIYEQSKLYEEPTLMEKCKSYIETRTEEVLNSSAFLNLTASTLSDVLTFERVSVSELELFQVCLLWSEKECQRQNIPDTAENKRAMMGDSLYLFHFPTMSLKEFANGVSCTGVLTTEDRCSVFEYLTCDDERRPKLSELRFPTTRRQRRDPLVLKRFRSFGKSNIYSGDCSMMRLQCDTPIVLMGFGISRSMGFDPLTDIQLTIKQDRTFLSNNMITVTDDPTNDVIKVYLKNPLQLLPSLWYTFIVTFHFTGEHDQGTCQRGKGGMKNVSVDGISFEFDRSDSGSLILEVIFSKSD